MQAFCQPAPLWAVIVSDISSLTEITHHSLSPSLDFVLPSLCPSLQTVPQSYNSFQFSVGNLQLIHSASLFQPQSINMSASVAVARAVLAGGILDKEIAKNPSDRAYPPNSNVTKTFLLPGLTPITLSGAPTALYVGIPVEKEADHLSILEVLRQLDSSFGESLASAGVDVSKANNSYGVYFVFRAPDGGSTATRVFQFQRLDRIGDDVITKLYAEDARNLPTVVLIIKDYLWKRRNTGYSTVYQDDPLHKSKILGYPMSLHGFALSEEQERKYKAKHNKMVKKMVELDDTQRRFGRTPK